MPSNAEVALAILCEAQQAGSEAYNTCQPQPMVVQQHSNPLDDNSPIEQQWHVPEGVCGFAWITVTCRNQVSRLFISGLKKAGQATSDINSFKGEAFKKSYGRPGFTYWVGGNSQSYERKRAYADAFAEVLKGYGINAYAAGRLD